MNSTLKYKFLQNLAKKRSNGGFTLIELLVVVIIVGILAAVALPNLLGQVGKARETEAKNGVGTINRAQQAYHFERGEMIGLSGTDFNETNKLGVVLETNFYDFDTSNVGGDTDTSTTTAGNATAVTDGTRNYSGGIAFNTNGQYRQVVCQSDTPKIAAADVTYPDTNTLEPSCPANFESLVD